MLKTKTYKRQIGKFSLDKKSRRLCPRELHLLNYRVNLPSIQYYHTRMPGNYNWLLSGNVKNSNHTNYVN